MRKQGGEGALDGRALINESTPVNWDGALVYLAKCNCNDLVRGGALLVRQNQLL